MYGTPHNQWTFPTRLSCYALAVFTLAWTGGGCRPVKAPSTVPPQPADQAAPAPASQNPLPTLNRQGFEDFLAEQHGKVVFVDFWATWCQPCVKGYPHTQALAEKYRDHDVVIAAISLDELDGRDAVLRFIETHQVTFPNFISAYGTASGQSMEEFDIPSGTIPTMKLYDRQGKLRATFGDGQPDAISWESVDVAIRALVMEPTATSGVR